MLMLSEIAEEYLEAIYDLTQHSKIAKTRDIAAAMKLTPASVSEMLKKLSTDHYINYEKYHGASLTNKGMEVALKIKRKHRLLERFLVDIVGANRTESHEEACRLEHVISDDSAKTICQLTNNPQFCPDGEPIPACLDKDCATCDTEPSVPLDTLNDGDSAEIVCLRGSESTDLRRLISMGFVPGRMVKLEERVPMGGPLLVKLEQSRIALAKDFARSVLVHREASRKRAIETAK